MFIGVNLFVLGEPACKALHQDVQQKKARESPPQHATPPPLLQAMAPLVDSSPLLPHPTPSLCNATSLPIEFYISGAGSLVSTSQRSSTTMAITHDDLSLRAHRSTDIRSKLAPSLAALSVVCGLFSFVLCLAAEGSRTEATWYITSNQGNGSKTYQCVYDGSGRRPLVFAVIAFLLLAVAMFAEHAYMLVAVTSPTPPAPVAWSPEDPRLSSSARNLAWQTCFLFLATWICFTIAEVLLMIGMAVESSHISQWTKPRPGCHVIRPGLFSAAGILGLITVFLGIALYLTAFRTQALHQVAEGMQRGAANAAHQHHLTPSAPGEPNATGAHQSQPPQANPSINKTSTSTSA